MKTIFDTATRDKLIQRVSSLNETNKSIWGKMNVYQMLKHCTKCQNMMFGEIKIKRVLIGRLIGLMILKKVLKDDAPFGRNSPTSSILKTVGDTGDLEQQKKEWIKKIEQYGSFGDTGFVHPFFGPMTKEQI